MKKIVTVLMALIFISLLVVPEKIKAQDSTSTGGGIKPQFLSRISADYRRGCTLFSGIDLKSKEDSSKFPAMSLLFSFSMPATKLEMTSFGLTYLIYPWKNGFGKFFAFGLDGIYFYTSNINLYSELYYGGLGQNTIKNPTALWTTQRWVVAPIVEFSIPIRDKFRIGTKINPLIYGYWNFNKSSNGYSHWHRWYDIDLLFVSLNFGK